MTPACNVMLFHSACSSNDPRAFNAGKFVYKSVVYLWYDMKCFWIILVKIINLTSAVGVQCHYSHLSGFRSRRGAAKHLLTLWQGCFSCTKYELFQTLKLMRYTSLLSLLSPFLNVMSPQFLPDPMSVHSSKSWGPRRSTSALVVTGTKGQSVEKKRKCCFKFSGITVFVRLFKDEHLIKSID